MTVPDVADFDILLGRSLDVVGQFFVSPGDVPIGGYRLGWPGVVVELDLQVRQVTGSGPWSDLVTPTLAARGLVPVPSMAAEPPEVDRIRWTVRLRDRGAKPSGVYGPGHGGRPGAWALITPAPANLPLLWSEVVRRHTGGQCGVFVTTHTRGATTERDPGVWERLFQAEADAGRLFATRAAVFS